MANSSFSDKLQNFQQQNPKRGFLTFQVFSAYGFFPIKNAKVTISKHIGDNYFISKVTMTDESGKTQPLEIPTPSKELSQNPNNPTPFSSYDVRIEASGYVTTDIFQIPVFEGINSIQPVDLSLDVKSENKKIVTYK